MELCREGRVIEVFGCGTAVVVVPLKTLGYGDEVWKFEIDEALGSGPICNYIYETILDIQYGRVEHEYQYLLD